MQDEPGNMGPWPRYSLNVWPERRRHRRAITRPRSSSPSVGTAKRHTEEQKALLAAAFDTEADRAVRALLTATGMYFTDRGIEELQQRRGDEEVTLAWLGDRLQEFTDTHPEFETAVERLATWLARLDDPED